MEIKGIPILYLFYLSYTHILQSIEKYWGGRVPSILPYLDNFIL